MVRKYARSSPIMTFLEVMDINFRFIGFYIALRQIMKAPNTEKE
jgi:hypothetical protein